MTIALLAHLDKYLSTKQDAAGSNPSQTDTQGLKATEKKVLPL